jgi:hypothetical protein
MTPTPNPRKMGAARRRKRRRRAMSGAGRRPPTFLFVCPILRLRRCVMNDNKQLRVRTAPAVVIRDIDNDLDLVRIVGVPEGTDDFFILRTAERAGLLEHGLYEELPRGALAVVWEDTAGPQALGVLTVSWADIRPVRLFVRGPDREWSDAVPAREAMEAIVEAIHGHLGLDHWPPEELGEDDAEAIRSLVEQGMDGEWACPCGQYGLQWEIACSA